MHSFSRPFLAGVAAIAVLLILAISFHLGGIAWEFSQLAGALVGGIIALFAARTPIRDDEEVEPWLGREQLGWTLVGCGIIMWGLGEMVWRYYILTNQSPFPSYADIGYASLPPLIFIGLMLQPSSDAGRGRLLTLLDSIMAMGALLSIAWYLLLGSLAFQSTENLAAKILGIYYPTTDVALLSFVILLLLRGQGKLYQSRARRLSLLVIALGLCVFATSDFIFNIQQNANLYVEGTWVDLGWPLGLMIIGVGIYLRRFLPLNSRDDTFEQLLQSRTEQTGIGAAQYLTYLLVGVLFVVLGLNVFSHDTLQESLRLVLFLATVSVVGIAIARQVLTIQENARLARRQADAVARLEAVNRQIEEQAEVTARRNADLEAGILHLKDVQARLANGNLRARAQLSGGELLPLAVSLNLMAERLLRVEQGIVQAQHLYKAIDDLVAAFERYKTGKPFVVPSSCNAFPELQRLLIAMGLRTRVEEATVSAPPASLQRPSIPDSSTIVARTPRPMGLRPTRPIGEQSERRG